MTDVVLSFNGRAYRLACAAGEEDRLVLLAQHVKDRLEALHAEHGDVGDDRLLLMAAIELADDLYDRTTERDAAVLRAETAERALPIRAKKAAGGG
jgi:cell division protein ZapA